jgi:hypothetical protein
MTETVRTTTTLRAGDLAYLDSFSGLVPCRIAIVTQGGPGNALTGKVTVQVTARRPGWAPGEYYTTVVAYVIPRTHVRRRGGRLRISTDYEIR